MSAQVVPMEGAARVQPSPSTTLYTDSVYFVPPCDPQGAVWAASYHPNGGSSRTSDSKPVLRLIERVRGRFSRPSGRDSPLSAQAVGQGGRTGSNPDGVGSIPTQPAIRDREWQFSAWPGTRTSRWCNSSIPDQFVVSALEQASGARAMLAATAKRV